MLINYFCKTCFGEVSPELDKQCYNKYTPYHIVIKRISYILFPFKIRRVLVYILLFILLNLDCKSITDKELKMLESNKLPLFSQSAQENGIFISLEPIKKFDEAEYLLFAKEAIEHYQTHPSQIPYGASSRLKLFQTPATAVIVGTGTVGLEAITYASRILPLHSTLLILQNDVEDPKKLEHTLKKSIQGSNNFKWIISPPIDLGRLDLVEEFLISHQNDLANA